MGAPPGSLPHESYLKIVSICEHGLGTPATGSGPTGHRRVEEGGVSSGHRSAVATARRPDPGGGDSPRDPRPPTATPQGRGEGLAVSTGTPGGAQAHLLAQRLSRDHRRRTWQRVKANTGAASMAGRASAACPALACHHWARRRSARAEGPSRPAARAAGAEANSHWGATPAGPPHRVRPSDSARHRAGHQPARCAPVPPAPRRMPAGPQGEPGACGEGRGPPRGAALRRRRATGSAAWTRGTSAG